MNLLTYLPAEAATTAALTGVHPATRWTVTDYLVAVVADQLAVANYQRFKASGGKGGTKPKPIPRPGDEPERILQGDSMSPEEITAILQSRYRGTTDDIPTDEEEVDDGD